MRIKEITETTLSPLDAMKHLATISDLLSGDTPTIGNMANAGLDALASPAAKNSDKNDTQVTTFRGGKGSVSPSDVSAYLKTKMDDNHRLGILANIQAESGFNPAAMGDNNTSGGLFQHHASRFSSMVNAVGNDWATNWKGQIDFALSEKAGREYLARQFSSPHEATAWWTKYFEVPANAAQQAAARINLLKNFS